MKSTSSPSRRRNTSPRFRFQSATGKSAPRRALTPTQLRARGAALQRWGRAQSTVASAQGACYLIMGLWPLTHMESFELFTGPKHNAALMQVTGGLLTVIGIILLLGSLQRAVSSTTAFLGAGIAAVLAILATSFVATGNMPAIYLWDVALETGFVAWWVVARLASRRHRPKTGTPSKEDDLIFTTFLSRREQDTLH